MRQNDGRWFKEGWLKRSEYPPDFIPRGATAFLGVDLGGSPATVVKGFAVHGEIHIQEIEEVENDTEAADTGLLKIGQDAHQAE